MINQVSYSVRTIFNLKRYLSLFTHRDRLRFSPSYITYTISTNFAYFSILIFIISNSLHLHNTLRAIIALIPARDHGKHSQPTALATDF